MDTNKDAIQIDWDKKVDDAPDPDDFVFVVILGGVFANQNMQEQVF